MYYADAVLAKINQMMYEKLTKKCEKNEKKGCTPQKNVYIKNVS